jgi:hypothetical protein
MFDNESEEGAPGLLHEITNTRGQYFTGHIPAQECVEHPRHLFSFYIIRKLDLLGMT